MGTLLDLLRGKTPLDFAAEIERLMAAAYWQGAAVGALGMLVVALALRRSESLKTRVVDLVVLAGAGVLLWHAASAWPTPAVSPAQPTPTPAKPDRRPRGDASEAKVGGNVSPDGTEEIHCDLPEAEHRRNVTSRGEGCCVQTSINHSARWQNVPALVDFQKWVQQKGLSGGANPELVDQRIPACCKDRGYPVVPYVQIRGAADLEMVKLACKGGRMPAGTYSRSPTGRYGGGRIAHMITLSHCSDKWVAVCDSNYIGSSNYEWMTPDEYQRYCNDGKTWIVVLLAPPPPNPPHN